MKLFAQLLVLCLALTGASADIHAVLVAGSRYYYNYRHQADICHAYQILLKNGVQAKNIIVMAYNDVANDRRNPYPGALYNHPGDDQENVYEGCVIDYEAEAVTPQNYLAVITGEKAKLNGGNGRVLQSNGNDEVFLYFSDHGAPGLIAFPSAELYAEDLNKAFKTMAQKKMYYKMTYYLEACESGSMFVNTPADINIYAVSAANPHQSSYAAYCPPQDKVNGRSIRSCLGDEFSVNWMENTEANDPSTETLQSQFEAVREKTKGSQVMQWGDLSFTSDPVGEFVGDSSQKKSNSFLQKIKSTLQPLQQKILHQQQPDVMGRVAVPKVKTNFLLAEFQENPTLENYRELQKDLQQSKKLTRAMEVFTQEYEFANIFSLDTDFDCYKSIVGKIQQQCGEINDFGLSLLRVAYNFCGQAQTMNVSVNNVQFAC